MKKYRNVLFLYNPNSGKGQITNYLDEITKTLSPSCGNLEVYQTRAPLDGMNKVQTDAGRYDLVICAGGDGTLSEVVSGMMQLEKRPPIGFIPAGSTNDTRSGFRLPRNILDAAGVCVDGTPFQADVGRFNDEYFTYVASLGSLSAVSCFTSQEMKRILGHGAYLIEGIKQLIRMESYEMRVETDGQTIEGDFFLGLVTNSMSVGGFEGITGGCVDLQDGLFEVALLRRPHNILEFSREVDQMLIHNKEDREVLDDLVVRFKTKKLSFSSKTPVQWVRDGENGGKHKQAQIEVIQKAVTIMSALPDR
ncbi:MAG: YegS/Rv2252/BmrU family lipid kinase [Parasporobacterium sp.]|nr:YegS/Rv2252/BmrU family lipid kinase [Parasporobacterium sp.]